MQAGETIALVGATGGGKTTIVSLLCRFYEPTSGTILLDGVDYREYGLHWLQSKLGIVLQTPHLFSGTIMENIRYGQLEAGDEEVRRVAGLAGAHDFITRLDKGYESEVGEGGRCRASGPAAARPTAASSPRPSRSLRRAAAWCSMASTSRCSVAACRIAR